MYLHMFNHDGNNNHNIINHNPMIDFQYSTAQACFWFMVYGSCSAFTLAVHSEHFFKYIFLARRLCLARLNGKHTSRLHVQRKPKQT